jgi:protein involved in polysaccharide export with SLBB domain
MLGSQRAAHGVADAGAPGVAVGRRQVWGCSKMIRWLVISWLCFMAPAAYAQGVSSSAAANGASVSANPSEYRLGAGDKVKISVYGEEALSGEFSIPGGSGTISFPLIGDVKASGLTASELRMAIEGALKPDYLKDPHVSIEILTYRPFYILGEVTRPGEYHYSSGLTILNAVATANGFTYRADTHYVYIKRAGSIQELKVRLDAKIVVEPGDTVRIGERFF